jgi:hypothetical protein
MSAIAPPAGDPMMEALCWRRPLNKIGRPGAVPRVESLQANASAASSAASTTDGVTDDVSAASR